jgi:predicted membrane protein
MSLFSVSSITSIIVSCIYCFYFYRREIGKQKEERRRRLEIKKEEIKVTNPKLYEMLKNL